MFHYHNPGIHSAFHKNQSKFCFVLFWNYSVAFQLIRIEYTVKTFFLNSSLLNIFSNVILNSIAVQNKRKMHHSLPSNFDKNSNNKKKKKKSHPISISCCHSPTCLNLCSWIHLFILTMAVSGNYSHVQNLGRHKWPRRLELLCCMGDVKHGVLVQFLSMLQVEMTQYFQFPGIDLEEGA